MGRGTERHTHATDTTRTRLAPITTQTPLSACVIVRQRPGFAAYCSHVSPSLHLLFFALHLQLFTDPPTLSLSISSSHDFLSSLTYSPFHPLPIEADTIFDNGTWPPHVSTAFMTNPRSLGWPSSSSSSSSSSSTKGPWVEHTCTTSAQVSPGTTSFKLRLRLFRSPVVCSPAVAPV